MNATTCHPLDQFELLPVAFRNVRRVRHVSYGWIATVVALLVSLCFAVIVSSLRLRAEHQAREHLVAAALPLFDLRRDVLQLQRDNARRMKWCEQVESAKPDDNVFQTIATVAATIPANRQNIKIDKFHIRLPLEYPGMAKEVPDWAAPRLLVSARVISADAASHWIAKLNASARIDGATIKNVSAGLLDGQMEVTAIPLATRVSP